MSRHLLFALVAVFCVSLSSCTSLPSHEAIGGGQRLAQDDSSGTTPAEEMRGSTDGKGGQQNPWPGEQYGPRTFNSELALRVFAKVMEGGEQRKKELGKTPAEESIEIPKCVCWGIKPQGDAGKVDWEALAQEVCHKDIPGLAAPEDTKDKHLSYLADMKTLRVLDLSGTGVTDEGLTHLKGLRNLQELDLDDTAVPGAAALYFERALAKEDPEAQGFVGNLYRIGAFLEQDKTKAATWYRKAAEQGDFSAQSTLGHMYREGEGVEQDYRKAVTWYRKAAEQSDTEAQYDLGAMPREGKGGQQDARKALKRLRKGVKQRRTKIKAGAAYKLGIMYDGGKGVEQNASRAAKWFRKAAQQGDADAQYNLGIMYHEGEGVEQDYDKAIKWWRRAAEQGVANAQYNLGVVYQHGTGVPQSDSNALEWFSRAVKSALAEDDREQAFTCYDRMREVAPDHPLTKRVYEKLYGEGETTGPAGKTASPETAQGTGWAVESGLVVTANHLLDDASKVRLIAPDGSESRATVATRDRANDLALLKPEDPSILGKALPVAEGDIDSGEKVAAVGYPYPDIMGKSVKITSGIVNSTRGPQDDPRLFQTSCSLQSGSSGGPLLTMKGQVAGVAVGKLDAVEVFEATGELPGDVGYAIKTAYLRPLLSERGQERVPVIEGQRLENLQELAEAAKQAVVRVIVEK